jgi:putative DNA primase/helicase
MCLDTQRRCVRWAADNLSALERSEVVDVDRLHDRAMDNWEPLLGIAASAGTDWLARATRTAIALSSEDDSDDAVETMLLADIQQIFGNRERLSSECLVDELVKMEERPWPEFSYGKAISTRQLAKMLKPFGVKPRQLRVDGGKVRGYESKWFHDAFARYLPNLSGTPVQRSSDAVLQRFASCTAESTVPDEDRPKPAPPLACTGVPRKSQVGGRSCLPIQKATTSTT